MNEQNHEPRCELTLSPGEKISLCRCWQSEKFPYCDGSHKKLDLATPVGPAVVRCIEKTES
jgi:CDGSH-type Zn-finger protein